MYDFEDLFGELIEECLDKNPAFKEKITFMIQDKLIDAVKSLELTNIVQNQVEEMIEYMINEDSEFFDTLRDTLADMISNKIEVTFK